MELDDRKVTILKAIIKTYLETGEPVGSRTISKYTDLKLSSATIRNEMSDLEEMGYTAEEVEAMGDPLVVEFRSFTAVRVMFVIGIVLVILSVLLFRRRYRIATRGSGLRRAEDLPG